jgi:acetyl esterase/lipase
VDWSDLPGFPKAAEARRQIALLGLTAAPPDVKQTEQEYTTRDGAKLRAKLYQPVHPPPDGSPLIVMYHGGGFCMGYPETEEPGCRSFVREYGATCLSVGYRLAPEYPFPYAINDAWDALKWAAARAQSLGADTSVGFVIGGTSAGGSMTAVLAHLARDEGLSPPLTGQYLGIPAVCPPSRMPEKYREFLLSPEQNKHAPLLPAAAIDMFMRGYAPDESSSLYNVLAAPHGHSNLPKAYFQLNGMDPIRDQGLIYEKILREENGTETRLDMYPGMPHAFFLSLPELKSTKLEAL